MGKRNNPAVVAEETVQEELVEETVVTPAVVAGPDSGSATVVWRNGTRTYTKAIHGADYRELAQEFADKVEGKIV